MNLTVSCLLLDEHGNLLSQHPNLTSAVAAARLLHCARHFAGLPRLGTTIRPASPRQPEESTHA